jgi:hypothetical protein
MTYDYRERKTVGILSDKLESKRSAFVLTLRYKDQ